MEREELIEAMNDLMLEDCAEKLADSAKPCCRMELEPEDEVEVGVCKFGGIPDVPNDFEWPVYNDYPLIFVAQFDLQVVGSMEEYPELPGKGLLSFFYDCAEQPAGDSPEHKGAGRVYLFTTDVQPAALPEQLDPEAQYQQCEVYYSPEVNIPNSKSLAMEALQIEKRDLSRIAAIEATVQKEEEPMHHLLGHAFQIQNDMQLQSQLVNSGIDCTDPAALESKKASKLALGADEWTLLFQCDSDPLPGWMWGDGGRLFFWIRKQDLAKKNFDDVCVILQSH